MHKICLLELDSVNCSDAIITVEKPTLIGPVGLVCPFNMTFGISDFTTSSVENEYAGTVWEFSFDNFLTTSYTTTTYVFDEPFVTFPPKLLSDQSVCQVRAHHLGLLKSSVKSDPLEVTLNVTALSSMSMSDLGDLNSNYATFQQVEVVGGEEFILWVRGDEAFSPIVIMLKRANGIIDQVATLAQPSTKIKGFSGLNSNGVAEYNAVNSCQDGMGNIFYLMTIVTYDPDTYVTAFNTVRLIKFNTLTNQFSILATTQTHARLNRDFMGLAYYNNKLYMKGGYEIGTDGKVITPTDTERTFMVYDLATNALTDMEVLGDLKPRDYRGSRLVSTDEGIWCFSGKGAPVAGDVGEGAWCPELWFFRFYTKKWEAFAHFPAQAYLTNYNDFGFSKDGKSLIVSFSNSGELKWYLFDLEDHYWIPQEPIRFLLAGGAVGEPYRSFIRDGYCYVVLSVEIQPDT